MKYIVTLNGKTYEVEVDDTSAYITNTSQAPAASPVPAKALQVPEDQPMPKIGAEGQQVKAPMPGIVLSIPVLPGQSVKAGEVLLVLEAMKMENEIVAAEDATIKQILVKDGATVNTDQVLLVLD